MKNWKRNGKKGFTLVELIVVLVILAILAALLIPALTGYINKAKEKQITAETRQVVMASQTLVDEYFAEQVLGTSVSATITGSAGLGTGSSAVTLAKIAELAEVKAGNITSVSVGNVESGVVDEVVYTRDGKICTYTKTAADEAGAYEITNATP